jgi:dephospho-CoA kinase
MPLDEKQGRATRVIMNDGDEASLRQRVREALAAATSPEPEIGAPGGSRG